MRGTLNRRQAPHRVSKAKALEELKEDNSVRCKTCSAPADEHYEPYCMTCALYWRDCGNGLYDEPIESERP